MRVTVMLHLAMAAAQLHAGGAAFANCTPAAAGPAAQACSATQTCAKSSYSGTGYSCCPLANAVDCGTPLGSCCPAEHVCKKTGAGWKIIVTCEPAAGGQPAVPGTPACKSGPLNRLTAGKKNCLIIGDSVSLGYTPFLTTALAADCVVQHGPSGGDGGAEETACESAAGNLLPPLSYMVHAPLAPSVIAGCLRPWTMALTAVPLGVPVLRWSGVPRFLPLEPGRPAQPSARLPFCCTPLSLQQAFQYRRRGGCQQNDRTLADGPRPARTPGPDPLQLWPAVRRAQRRCGPSSAATPPPVPWLRL